MANKQHFTEQQMEEALRKSRGIISYAAKEAGCSYGTVKNYIARNEHLQQVLTEVTERQLDVTEEKLFDLIDQGNLTAIIFFLKCKGKHRGYVERQQIEHSGEFKFTPEQRADTIQKIKGMLLEEVA